jgi:serine/threonine-protein kinase RsbW
VTGRRTTVRGEAAQLPVLTRWLQEFWAAADLPAAAAMPFELALEEVFMNVVTHGRRPGEVAEVEVALELSPAGLTMTVEDDGPPFDPLSLPSPDVEASLTARPVGGLGVFLVRQMMDVVRYSRVGPRNRLTMSKGLGS